MNKTKTIIRVAFFVTLMAGGVYARDLGVLVLPIHEKKFTSSLMYEALKIEDDFKTRGIATFKAQVVGALFSYGVTDRVAVAVKGGTLIDPRVEAQGSTWESRAGYLYGVDLYNEVFPVTEHRLGVQLSGGVTGFQVPLDRANIGDSGTVHIDQNMTGMEYHGAVTAVFKIGICDPYAGVRAFGSTVEWRDNDPGSGPSEITGHADGNISIVTGLPVRISKDVRLFVEGRWVSETAITAGITIASF